MAMFIGVMGKGENEMLCSLRHAPSTGEELCRCAEASVNDVDRAVRMLHGRRWNL